MCAPLVCQSIIAKGIAWNHFYFGSLVLSALSSALAFCAFHPTKDEREADGMESLKIRNTQPTDLKELKSTPTICVDEANLSEVKNCSASPDRKLGMYASKFSKGKLRS